MNRNLAAILQQYCIPGVEFVIYRSAFRWKLYNPMVGDETVWPNCDEVLNNHYDSMSLEQLAEDFGYEIAWEYNFKHVAIVRKK